MVVETNTETATDKFERLCAGQSSLITEDELDFIASVFEAMSPDRKVDFFANNSLLAVKVVGRQDRVRPGSVSVSDSGTSVSTLTSIDDETSEMHILYGTVTYQDTFNKHIWRSIVVCLKDRIFPKIKFWKDSKTSFHVPDFRSRLPKNQHEQSRKVCEMLMDFVCDKDQGDMHSMRKKVAFWKLYAPLVRAEMVDYRANTAAQVRKGYLEGKKNFKTSM